MTKAEALSQFLNTEAKAASIKFVAGTMSNLEKGKKKDTTRQFRDAVDQALTAAPDLYFLQVVLVRLKALAGEPFYRLEAYGPDFYLSEPIYAKVLHVDWLYQPYVQFCRELDGESRKYMFQIGKQELDQIKLAELHNCQKIMRYLFSESIPNLLCSKEYQALDARKKVQIHLAEYQGPYEILLTKDEAMEKMGGTFLELLQDEGGNRAG